MIQQFHFPVYTQKIASKVSNRYLYTHVRNITHNSLETYAPAIEAQSLNH